MSSARNHAKRSHRSEQVKVHAAARHMSGTRSKQYIRRHVEPGRSRLLPWLTRLPLRRAHKIETKEGA